MAIRVGIIGLQHGAQVHIPAYKANPRYEVMAVCARTPGRAEAVAQEHGIPRWYTDPRQMMAAKDIDLISIAAPPHTHAGLTAMALGTEKHVVVEIGFVPTALDARILLDLARERRRIGSPAYVLRYTPVLRLVSDLLAQKRIGQPKLMRVEYLSDFLAQPDPRYQWIWDDDNGGGVLANFVSQMFYLGRAWFGPVRAVDATLATLSDMATPTGTSALGDDTGFVTLHFESGMLATLSHCAVTTYSTSRIELHGTAGSLLIDGFGDEMSWLGRGAQGPQPLFAPEAYLEETRGHSGLLGGFHVYLERLAEVITSGGKARVDLPSFVDGLEVTRIIDAAKLSAREHRQVKLKEIPA